MYSASPSLLYVIPGRPQPVPNYWWVAAVVATLLAVVATFPAVVVVLEKRLRCRPCKKNQKKVKKADCQIICIQEPIENVIIDNNEWIVDDGDIDETQNVIELNYITYNLLTKLFRTSIHLPFNSFIF